MPPKSTNARTRSFRVTDAIEFGRLFKDTRKLLTGQFPLEKPEIFCENNTVPTFVFAVEVSSSDKVTFTPIDPTSLQPTVSATDQDSSTTVEALDPDPTKPPLKFPYFCYGPDFTYLGVKKTGLGNDRQMTDEEEKRLIEIQGKTKSDFPSDELIAVVGYDTEYQELPQTDFNQKPNAQMVSHQFYFANRNWRFGIILLTDLRLTESAFVQLIAELLHPAIRQVYVCAHYSIVEGGWMISEKISYNTVKQRYEDFSYPQEAACLDIEEQFLKAIVKREMRTDSSKKDSTSDDTTPKKSKSAENEVFNAYLNTSSFPLPETVSSHFKQYKNFEDAWKAVHGGYAKIQVGPNQFEQALILSKELQEKYKKQNPYQTLIQNYSKTWTGRIGVISETVDNYLRKTNARSSIKARNKFDAHREPLTMEHLVSAAVVDRNSTSTRDLNGNRSLWNLIIDRRANGERSSKSIVLGPDENGASREAVQFHFVDTNHFNTDDGKSLKAFGKLIGIAKDELTEAEISNVLKLHKEDPLKFYKYGIIDSIITAETLAFFWRIFWLDLGASRSTRVTEYSNKVFGRIFRNEVYGELIKDASDKRKRRQKHFKESESSDPDEIHELFPDYDPDDPEYGNRDASENLKYYLGWEKRKGKKGKPDFWWPSVEVQLFSVYYYGGLNNCIEVGTTGPCVYYDLKSAYPCAGLMLQHDYNYRKPIEKRKNDARRFVEELYRRDNPFQIIGIDLSFSFKSDVEPIFPTKFDRNNIPSLSLTEASDTLLYIRSGQAQIMWPELYVALKYDLLESYTIHRTLTYEQLPGPSKFAEHIHNFLVKRGETGKKMLMKELLNFIYGLTARGITRRITTVSDQLTAAKTKPGGLTCFPIAAYCTSVCRAVISELLAKRNPCYAITTDGFISPKMDDLEKGPLAIRTDKKLQSMKNEAGESLGYKYIEADFVADRAVFIKTRGYLLVNDEAVKSERNDALETRQQENSATSSTPSVAKKKPKPTKLAQMGIQTESRKELKDGARDIEKAKDFLKILNEKKYPKNSWPSFSSIKKDDRNDLPIPTVRISSCSHTYDMKRIPDGIIREETFEFEGVSLTIPGFSTRALNDLPDFIKLRHEMLPNQSVADYEKLLKRLDRSTKSKS